MCYRVATVVKEYILYISKNTTVQVQIKKKTLHRSELIFVKRKKRKKERKKEKKKRKKEKGTAHRFVCLFVLFCYFFCFVFVLFCFVLFCFVLPWEVETDYLFIFLPYFWPFKPDTYSLHVVCDL